MNRATILSVQWVYKNVDTPFFLITIATGKNGKGIVRTLNQFQNDLENSNLLVLPQGEVMKPHSRKVQRVLRSIRNGSVNGDFKFVEAGSTYIVEQFSSAHINDGVPVGTEMKRESDGYRVEGFLSIDPSDAQLQREENAEAYAEVAASFAGTSAFSSTPTSGSSDPESEPEPSVNDDAQRILADAARDAAKSKKK